MLTLEEIRLVLLGLAEGMRNRSLYSEDERRKVRQLMEKLSQREKNEHIDVDG